MRFAKRSTEYISDVQDGQMLVLGGLIDEGIESEFKVPFLGDILVLGTRLNQPALRLRKEPDGLHQANHYS